MALMGRALDQARHGFYGWRVVALMLGPRAAGVGVYVFGNTLFVLPLEQELGIDRTVSSLLFALSALVTGIAAPISGVFMDRFGPRIVLLASVIVTSLGYVLFAASTNVVTVFIVFLGPVSLAVLNVAFNASSGIVNNWFDRQKGLAFSLLQVGAAVGSFVILPAMAFSIDQWGWRAAALVAAGIVLVLGMPASLLTRDSPEELGLLPDGDPPEDVTTRRGKPVLTGASAAQALRTRGFWMLAAAVFFIGGGTIGVQVHFVPILVWKGVAEVQAGLMLTAVALAGVPLVLAIGFAVDRFDRLVVGAIVCLASGFGVLLMTVGSGWVLWPGVALFASNMGIWPIAWAVIGQMFGRRAYSTIRGYIMAGQTIGTSALPVLIGALYDRVGSYTPALWLAVALWLTGAALMLLTPRRTYSDPHPTGATIPSPSMGED